MELLLHVEYLFAWPVESPLPGVAMAEELPLLTHTTVFVFERDLASRSGCLGMGKGSSPSKHGTPWDGAADVDGEEEEGQGNYCVVRRAGA